jgi:hypothetical protein
MVESAQKKMGNLMILMAEYNPVVAFCSHTKMSGKYGEYMVNHPPTGDYGRLRRVPPVISWIINPLRVINSPQPKGYPK